ncbi:MAG TPA: SCO family protein [Verrucomicrobiota bacterium]|nr:SCO family protein [Verrucomicrobiota bacterium]
MNIEIQSICKRTANPVTLWTAVASGARHRFCSERTSFGPDESAVVAALCRRSPKVRAALLLMALVVAGVSAFAADSDRTSDHDYDAPAPGTYTLPVVKPAADGDVLDSTGRELKLSELTHGRITVMSFIYTRCAAAKACPMATGVLRDLHILSAQDSSLATNMRLVSMSFDPGNDTPERMAAYSTLAQGRKNASEWRFITTASQEKLSPILEAYGQAVDRKSNPTDPTGPLNHTLRVFLVDRDGNIRNIYSSGTLDVRLVLADVKTLMMEQNQIASNKTTNSDH